MDVDAQHESPPNAPKSHESLWFSDGNVVLGTDSFLFKVHKSFLSLYAFVTVFRDEEVPNINDDGLGQSGAGIAASELYEGLPSVTLAGDKGEDVVHLLRTIYYEHRYVLRYSSRYQSYNHFQSYYHRDNDNTSLDAVVALLLLSTKYDFKDIRNDVVIQISKHYPMIMSLWTTTPCRFLAGGGMTALSPCSREHSRLTSTFCC